MDIYLNQVVPDYISEERRAHSQIWNQKVRIPHNEHLHIVAPSGSGKTSLIHFIYGLRKDYSGEILYDDIALEKLSSEGFSNFRKNKISIIFQDLRLFETQTVWENILIKSRLEPYHTEEEIRKMAERLGIEPLLNQVAKTCSYGEQQRVAILRSLVQPFSILLLDEPYSHLDEANRVKATALIYEECERRKASMIFADLKPVEYLKNEKTLYL